MMKSMILTMSLVLGSVFMSAACDDDKKEDDVEVDAPGVDVKVEELGAAGSAAPSDE